MEREIGERFTYNNLELEVVRHPHQKKCGSDCSGCYPYLIAQNEKQALQICNSLHQESGWCGKIERKDRIDVIFVPVKR